MAWKHSFGPQQFFAFAALRLLPKPCWQGSLVFPSGTFLQLENSISFAVEKAASFSLRCLSNDASRTLKLSGSHSQPSFFRILSKNFCKVSSSCFASYARKFVSKFSLSTQLVGWCTFLSILDFWISFEFLNFFNLKIWKSLRQCFWTCLTTLFHGFGYHRNTNIIFTCTYLNLHVLKYHCSKPIKLHKFLM